MAIASHSLPLIFEGQDHDRDPAYFNFAHEAHLGLKKGPSLSPLPTKKVVTAAMLLSLPQEVLNATSEFTANLEVVQEELETTAAASLLDDPGKKNNPDPAAAAADLASCPPVAPRLSLSPPAGPFVTLPFIPPPKRFFEESNVDLEEERRRLELKALDDAWLKHMADAIREGRDHKPRPIIFAMQTPPRKKRPLRKKDHSATVSSPTLDRLTSKSLATLERMRASERKRRLRKSSKSGMFSAMMPSATETSGRKAASAPRPLNPIDYRHHQQPSSILVGSGGVIAAGREIIADQARDERRRRRSDAGARVLR